MQTQKMSLANIKGKLSTAEMKKIIAGSGSGCTEPGEYMPTQLACNGVNYWAPVSCWNGSCVYSVFC